MLFAEKSNMQLNLAYSSIKLFKVDYLRRSTSIEEISDSVCTVNR